jgi:hypothetical protein
MRSTRTLLGLPVSAALLSALLILFLPVRAAHAVGAFFDDLPRKGYIRDDVSLDVLSAQDGARAVIATIRYMRLVLDPGRRDVVTDFWPERQMVMVQLASGGNLVFERLGKLPAPKDPQDLQPRGRIGLEGGTAIELFSRSGSGGPAGGAGARSLCDSLDTLLRSGNQEIPLAKADLSSLTVRDAMAKFVERTLSPLALGMIAETVPVLLAAQTQGIPAGPLEVLELLFPGRKFVVSAQSLSFRVAAGAPLNPAEGSWRTVTNAPEMLPGAPLY